MKDNFIKGFLYKEIYRNEINGYMVGLFKIKDNNIDYDDDMIHITGILPRLSEKKEYILKVLLEPVEIHQINGNNYLVFKGESHRYHEPFNSLLDEDKIYFSENLETKRLNKFPFDGKRMVGVLGEEYCNKFYSLLVNNHYNFAPLL